MSLPLTRSVCRRLRLSPPDRLLLSVFLLKESNALAAGSSRPTGCHATAHDCKSSCSCSKSPTHTINLLGLASGVLHFTLPFRNFCDTGVLPTDINNTAFWIARYYAPWFRLFSLAHLPTFLRNTWRHHFLLVGYGMRSKATDSSTCFWRTVVCKCLTGSNCIYQAIERYRNPHTVFLP